MDVDKLFKLPSLPSAAVNKRKWSAARPDDSSSPSSSSQPAAEAGPSEPSRPHKAARVDDEQDHQDAANDPLEDETYFFSDDDQEDGRFFGGGLTNEQQQILDIMDSGPPTDPSYPSLTVDIASLRKQLLRFEKAINRNAEQRVKYASSPAKFIDSEADLDAELKGLLVLTTQPEDFYPELVKLGGAASLVGLLSHENADIAAGAIEVIEELTDDDVLDQIQPEDGDDQGERDGRAREAATAALEQLVEALLDNSLLELLVSNLARFNDEVDDKVPEEQRASRAVEAEGDSQAIYHTLGAIENLVSSRAKQADRLVASTPFLSWVLTRLATKKHAVDHNTSYAAELLAILLQTSEPNRAKLGATKVDDGESGIDVLLGVLAEYRRNAPSGAEEEEFVENVFDCICLALFDSYNKTLFLGGEGVELMVLTMKEKKSFGRVRAVKVLDHASSGPQGGAACARLVEVGGLAPLFSVFMDCSADAGRKKRKSAKAPVTLQDAEHILGIFCSLLTHLPSESIERIRLMAKFVGDSYEKVDQLLDLRDALTSRLESIAPSKAVGEEDDEDQEETYLAKLEHGLFSLQLLDTVVAWIVMEDDAVKDHVKTLLKRKGLGFSAIVRTLSEYRDNIGDQVSIENTNRPEHGQGEQAAELKTKDILTALIAYLEAL